MIKFPISYVITLKNFVRLYHLIDKSVSFIFHSLPTPQEYESYLLLIALVPICPAIFAVIGDSLSYLGLRHQLIWDIIPLYYLP